MPVITKIEEQKNNKNRVNIYVDDDFLIGTYKELIYKLSLNKGKDIDEEKLKELLEEEEFLKAKNKAYQILNKSMQSEEVLIKKLLDRGFGEGVIDRVIEKLKEYKMINDEILSRSIVKNKMNVKKHGKNRILQDLYNKKIPKDTINKVLDEEFDDDSEFENALYLGEKKLSKIKDEDRNKIYRKLSQHLAYRGFDYDVIKRVINRLTK